VSGSQQADSFNSGDFRFAPTKDADISLVTSIDSDGDVTSLTAIKWISNNKFVIRISKNLEALHREKVQRRFVRLQEPVATQLQQKVQQAATSREKYRRLNEAQRQYDSVNSTWGVFKSTF